MPDDFHQTVTADLNDPEFLKIFQKGLSESRVLLQMHFLIPIHSLADISICGPHWLRAKSAESFRLERRT
jgi:hypothetical protein